MRTSRTAMFFVLAVVMVSVLVRSVVLAQGTTTSAITGKVTSKAGEPLPGANVIAVHEPSGTKYGTNTRTDGRYTIPNMRVGGPYTVTVSLVGYQKQTQREVYLQLSQVLDLNFSLAEEAVTGEEVIVVGERTAIFNASRTGAATSVNTEAIKVLPTISRTIGDGGRFLLQQLIRSCGSAG